MEIVIIKSSELNKCWSALQYTNTCYKCEKLLQCKVASKYHLEGLNKYKVDIIQKLIKEKENKIQTLTDNINNTLEIIKKGII